MSASIPQAQSEPSDLIAKTMKSPRPTSTQFVSGETRVGTAMLAPLWPAQRYCHPQNQRLPSDCKPTFSILSAHTLIQFVAEPACTGTELFWLEPFPNCPAQLFPQAHNVPSFFRAALCQPTAAT